jgi:hypothetical protein
VLWMRDGDPREPDGDAADSPAEPPADAPPAEGPSRAEGPA